MTDISKKSERLDSIISQMRNQLSTSLFDIGFLEGTIDNQNVGSKIEHSFSGHALDISIRAVVDKVVLFVSRSLDTNGNSLPQFVKSIEGQGFQLERQRRAKHPDWPDDALEIGCLETKISNLAQRVEELKKSAEFQSVILHRDEKLAHHLENISGARRKLERKGIQIDPISYSQLVQLARKCAELTREAVRIWTFTVHDIEGTLSMARKYTEEFWAILPKLSDLEKAR